MRAGAASCASEPALARVHHRLDLLLLPDDPDRAIVAAAWPGLRAAWEAAGWIVAGRGRPPLIAGGCARVWLDQPGALTLYKNEQGGFRVDCPACGMALAGPFGRAMEAWRRGGPRAVDCSSCGRSLGFDGLAFSPPAAYAWGALVFSDVGGIELLDEAAAQAAAVLGPCRRLLRRLA